MFSLEYQFLTVQNPFALLMAQFVVLCPLLLPLSQINNQSMPSISTRSTSLFFPIVIIFTCDSHYLVLGFIRFPQR